MTTSTNGLAELSINTIRTLSMDAVEKAKSGHPGTPMALAPLAFTLYTRVMKHSPKHPDWFDRDRFILSAGHASMLLYSTLYLVGLRAHARRPEELPPARQPDRRAPRVRRRRRDRGHHRPARPGPRDVGRAGAGRARCSPRASTAATTQLIDHHTYVIASDGDIQEGVGSEASSLAGHLGLGKLIVFYDNNHIQLAGETSMSFSEDVGKRYEAYGWHVQDVGEDLSVETSSGPPRRRRASSDRPSLVIVRSHIGYGSPNKQDTYSGARLAARRGRGEGSPRRPTAGRPTRPSTCPTRRASRSRRRASAARQLVAEWEQRLAAFRDAEPDAAAELDLIMDGRLPDGWDGDVPTFSPDDGDGGHPQGVAAGDPVGRQQGAESGQRLGGPRALDAHRDRRRRLRGARRLQRPQRPLRRARARHGRDRERARAARVARVRLDVLQLPRLHEARRAAGVADGDPVDLRVHARLDRPGRGRARPTSPWSSSRSCAPSRTCTACARRTRTRPRSRGSSRSGRPRRPRRSCSAARACRSGIRTRSRTTPSTAARTCCASPRTDEPDLILIGTGSEVHICVEAAELLEEDGIATRVVSAPCLDRFAEQDDDYRESVLPRGGARASVGRGGHHHLAGAPGSERMGRRLG